MKAFLGALILAISSSATAGQIYQCEGRNGEVVFTDKPCSSGVSEQYQAAPISIAPAAKPTGNQRSVSQRRADAAWDRERKTAARVRQIKIENADPQKCQAARQGLANMKRGDPIGYSLDVSAFEYRQKIQLYCGL